MNDAQATPRLPIKAGDDPRIRGLAHLMALIAANPEIRRVDALVVTPTDATFANDPPADRVWVRLSPSFEPTTPFCQAGPGRVSYRAPALLTVETKCPGYLWENSALLWAAIDRAINPVRKQPGDRLAFAAALRAHGISELEFSPGMTTDPAKPAVGKVRIITYI